MQLNHEPPDYAYSLRAADGRDVASWWDGRRFDAILLDAPCSATGVIRRHPDWVNAVLDDTRSRHFWSDSDLERMRNKWLLPRD